MKVEHIIGKLKFSLLILFLATSCFCQLPNCEKEDVREEPECTNSEFRYFWTFWEPVKEAGIGGRVTLFGGSVLRLNRHCCEPEKLFWMRFYKHDVEQRTVHLLSNTKRQRIVHDLRTSKPANYSTRGPKDLIISNTQLSDTGFYSVRMFSGENKTQQIKERNETFLIRGRSGNSKPVPKVIYKDEILNYTYENGAEELFLDCSYRVAGNASVTWKRNNKVLHDKHFFIHNSMKLNTSWESGEYRCDVTNDEGSFTRNFVVTGKPEVIDDKVDQIEIFKKIFNNPYYITLLLFLVALFFVVVLVSVRVYLKSYRRRISQTALQKWTVGCNDIDEVRK